jgi:hypothetical protein
VIALFRPRDFSEDQLLDESLKSHGGHARMPLAGHAAFHHRPKMRGDVTRELRGGDNP